VEEEGERERAQRGLRGGEKGGEGGGGLKRKIRIQWIPEITACGIPLSKQ
jgi:hypothetical protein